MEFYGLADEIADAPTEEDVKKPDYEIWPENLKALNLFLALATQWDMVVSPDGEMIRTGLKYPSIDCVLARTNGIQQREWNQLHAQMRMMEGAALKEMTAARIARQERRQAEAERNRSNS